MIKRNELKEFKINNKNDIKDFFKYILNELKVCFHPDDVFEDYINFETNERTFDDEAATYLNNIMSECFSICETNDLDIYEIAIEVEESISE